MNPGNIGHAALIVGVIGTFLSIAGYIGVLRNPASKPIRLFARFCYALAAFGMIGAFASIGWLVWHKEYQYVYACEHTSNDLQGFYRLAASWSGQEGSFALWGFWTSIIGFLVLAKAGKYEPRVMPFFVTIIGFLCAILIKQSPFHLVPPPTAADLIAHPGILIPLDGQGLNPSLQNYWMTIHPPTIFFGFASLAVPFCYAIAAMIWKDYDRWTPRVMPYALLSCATLGCGLFMGGYWAYETQGWHGFWAWDPVENASFFPWLAVTALVHGLVVQKSRGGMARTNTFLAWLAFTLFLVGTYITRSGALANKDASGELLSVHAFDNISKSGLILMVAMLAFYGVGGLTLWLVRVWKMPKRSTIGETLLSRDAAFYLAVTLMLAACFVVTAGTTAPLFQGWLHRPLHAFQASFYNHAMIPIALVAALALGMVPWLAWRKTDTEVFLKKLMVPWFIMLGFGFFMVWFALGAERDMQATYAAQIALDPGFGELQRQTTSAWGNPTIERLSVILLATVGLFAALSNAMLGFRVFRRKPLNAGGWLAHVGIGVMMIGVVVSNTYERTEPVELRQGDPPIEKFGYKFQFENMTGKAPDFRPNNPDYDKENAVAIRVTPPGADNASVSSGEEQTFLIKPRWFAHNIDHVASESQLERMRWPSISHYLGHDLYVGLANDAQYGYHSVELTPGGSGNLGPYGVFYVRQFGEPGKVMGALVAIKTADGKVVYAQPKLVMDGGGMSPADVAIPELRDKDGVAGSVYLKKIDPATHAATLLFSLPDLPGTWEVPLEVTFKPWVNLVWIGVIIAVFGTLIAMTRRAIDARKIRDDGDEVTVAPEDLPDPWAIPDEAEAPLVAAAKLKPAPRRSGRPAST